LTEHIPGLPVDVIVTRDAAYSVISCLFSYSKWWNDTCCSWI